MKSQLILQTAIVRDVFSWFGLDPGRDIATLELRFAHEGNAFLEEVLPSLDSHLLDGIETGFFSPIEGWKKQKDSVLPQFLSELWNKVFNPDGSISDSLDVNAVRGLRQISLFSKKIFEVCSQNRVDAAIQQYLDTDNSLRAVEIPHINMLSGIFDVMFSKTIRKAVRLSNEPFHAFKHGPGTVAERYKDPVRKYAFDSVPEPVLTEFGYETFRPFWSDGRPSPKDSVIPARLIAVPKTALKPRLICIEPSYNQYIQQGLQGNLRRSLSDTPCGYDDQGENQRRARLGSIDGSLATIDLSEASDRVHLGVLSMMLASHPAFLNIIQKVRSQLVQLPDGRELKLFKFASMGNALTFPIEGMYFTTLVSYAMCMQDGDFSVDVVKRHARENIRVYGDDIIIPTVYFDTVVKVLETFGLKVNRSKSFRGHSKGFSFRESCGGDFINGVNITPIYRRRHVPSSRSQVDEIVSSIATQNQLYNSGLYPLTSGVYSDLLHKLGIPTLPYTSTSKLRSTEKPGYESTDSEPWALGQCAHCESSIVYNSNLQRFEIKTWMPRNQQRGNPIEGWERLASSLNRNLIPNKDGIVDRSPDGRVGRVKLRTTRVEVTVM